MNLRTFFAGSTGFLALLAAGSIMFATPSMALTMKECSAKYKAAQAAGTTKGLKWSEFRAQNCGSESSEPDELDANEEPAKSTISAPRGVTFPRKIDAQYADLSAGKGRMKTCADAYHVNKNNGTLGNLKWIQKGGGYYSLCNARLKGE